MGKQESLSCSVTDIFQKEARASFALVLATSILLTYTSS